jgi:hypothetical protein
MQKKLKLLPQAARMVKKRTMGSTFYNAPIFQWPHYTFGLTTLFSWRLGLCAVA